MKPQYSSVFTICILCGVHVSKFCSQYGEMFLHYSPLLYRRASAGGIQVQGRRTIDAPTHVLFAQHPSASRGRLQAGEQLSRLRMFCSPSTPPRAGAAQAKRLGRRTNLKILRVWMPNLLQIASKSSNSAGWKRTNS